LKWGLLILLYASVLIDIFTTFFRKNYLVLESNGFFSVTSYIVIFLKFIIPLFLWYELFYLIQDKKKLKYFIITIIVLLICIQFYAGYNNIKIQQSVYNSVIEKNPELIGTPIGDIPMVEIQKFALANDLAMKKYLKLIMVMLYYPLFTAFTSFWIYTKMEEQK